MADDRADPSVVAEHYRRRLTLEADSVDVGAARFGELGCSAKEMMSGVSGWGQEGYELDVSP